MRASCRDHCTGGTASTACRGFSLVELMVTVAVLAILVAIAFPSFTSLTNSNRLTSAANELLASLQYARSEAIRRNRTLVLCPSSDATSCGNGSWNQWIVIVKTGGEVLRIGTAKMPLSINGSPAIVSNGNSVEFRADGLARDSMGALLNAAVGVCLPTKQPQTNLRFVVIASGSRVAVSSASDGGTCGAFTDMPTTL